MKRWKNSVRQFLVASEETSKFKLDGGVSWTFPCVLHIFDLLSQNILDEEYNLTKVLLMCLMMVLQYYSEHE